MSGERVCLEDEAPGKPGEAGHEAEARRNLRWKGERLRLGDRGFGKAEGAPQPCGGMGLSAGGREGEQKQMMDVETPGWAARNRGSQVTETQ